MTTLGRTFIMNFTRYLKWWDASPSILLPATEHRRHSQNFNFVSNDEE